MESFSVEGSSTRSAGQMTFELTNLVALVQAYGLPALVLVGGLVIARDAVRRGFSLHVEVGRKRS